MPSAPRARAGLFAVGLLLAACSRQTTTAVTTDTLAPALDAALECSRSMHQSLDQDQTALFMEPTATAEQIASVRSMLEADRSLSRVTFVSQEDALAEFKLLFADSPQLVASVTAELLPASFRFASMSPKTSVSSSGDGLARYRTAPGVKQLVTLGQPTGCAATDPAMVKAAQRMIDNRWGANSIIVFMEPTRPEALPAMRTELEGSPDVRGMVYVSQDESLKEFQCLFKDDPETISGVTKEILPPSFRIDVGTDQSVIARTAASLKERPSVKQVVTRPTPAQILTSVGSTTGGAGHAPNTDCPVQGERIR